MSNYTLMPLHSFRLKIYGIVLSATVIVLMIILKFNETLTVSSSLSRESMFNYLLLINCLGLFIIAYSKERHEDERVQILRNKTFRVSFVFLLALLISNSFTALVFNLDPSVLNITTVVPIDITVALSLHLLIFYIRIYTNSNISGPELTVMQNILMNKTLSFILLIVMIVTSIVLLFI